MPPLARRQRLRDTAPDDPETPVRYRRRMVTFVVRAAVEPDGVVTGIVHRVRTGEKARFAGAEELAAVVARMLVGASEEPDAAAVEEEQP